MRFTPFALALALLGCGDDQNPDEARALWNEIQAADYRSFARAPGYESRQPSNAPHSDQVEIFVNDVVQQALITAMPLDRWPVGSLIVKEGYADDGELDLVAVMEKSGEGESGWFWAEYVDLEAEGEAKYSGEPGICTGCHASGEDYVRAFALP